MKGDGLLPLNDLTGADLQQKVFARWINVQLHDTNRKVSENHCRRLKTNYHHALISGLFTDKANLSNS